MNQNHKKMTERPTKTTIEQYAREGRKMMRNNKKASIFGFWDFWPGDRHVGGVLQGIWELSLALN